MLVQFNFLNFLSFLLLLSILFAEQSFATTSGKALFEQCSACHGVKGEGSNALNSPAIGGQDASYITRQIEHFAQNIRADGEFAKPMVAIAKGLSSSDIIELALYIQSLPVPEKASTTLPGNLKNGSRYYQAKCGACHGGQAQGNKAFNAPRLAGQSSQYLMQQMQDFVNGKRGSHKKDKLGRQMAMMAKMAKGQELTDILYYIAIQETQQ